LYQYNTTRHLTKRHLLRNATRHKTSPVTKQHQPRNVIISTITSVNFDLLKHIF
jgi:hypothetical protein